MLMRLAQAVETSPQPSAENPPQPVAPDQNTAVPAVVVEEEAPGKTTEKTGTAPASPEPGSGQPSSADTAAPAVVDQGTPQPAPADPPRNGQSKKSGKEPALQDAIATPSTPQPSSQQQQKPAAQSQGTPDVQPAVNVKKGEKRKRNRDQEPASSGKAAPPATVAQPAQVPQGAAGISAAEAAARRLIAGRRPFAELSREQFRDLVKTTQELLDSDGLLPETRKALERVATDAENYRNAQVKSAASGRSVDKKFKFKLNLNIDLGGLVMGGPNAAAMDFLQDDRPSRNLPDSALRERIGTARDLLTVPGLDRRLRVPVEQRMTQDRQELRARIDQASGGAFRDTPYDQADRVARRLLRDDRAPEQLNEDTLRERVKQARAVLAMEGLSRETFSVLRIRLQDDRTELRARVATRDPAPGRRADRTAGDYSIDDLLRDKRPSRSLARPELEHRVSLARRALAEVRLTEAQAARVTRQLNADRDEWRARRLGERDRRSVELGRARSRNEATIVIGSRDKFRARANVTAAEADEAMLLLQFTAPPVRRLEDRYTLEQIALTPGLRQIMPGVELDTVRFGFNEHAVRDDQIAELERIGLIMEKILSISGDEVFLIEGHTDAIGSDAYNLALSRKRADAIRAALLDYFVLPSGTIMTVGYGEQFLRIPTPDAEPENRRVTIRRITPLLRR